MFIPGRIDAVRSERRWLLAFSLGVMAVTTLPYFLGFQLQSPDWHFTGFVFGVDDGNSYIAKMLSGAAGAWLFRTPYTWISQEGVMAFPLYLLLGKLASPPGQHLQLVVIFHLFRLLAGLLAIWATYDFLALFLPETRYRRLGLTVAVLGGGLGWVLVLAGRSTWLNSLPLEFYSPESFGFLALFGLPHLSLARAGLLWGLCGYLAFGEQRDAPGRLDWRAWLGFRGQPRARKRAAASGLAWLLVGFAQPLTVVIAWWVVGVHLLALVVIWYFPRRDGRSGELRQAPWLQVRNAIWMVSISSPVVIYTLLAFRSDPFLRAWTSQNLILSPHPAVYVLAYGLLLPLALTGGRRLLRDHGGRALLPVAWVASLPLLAYAPFNLQRRLPEGLWVALVILAIAGWRVVTRTGGPWRWVARILLAAVFPSTLLLVAGGTATARRIDKPVYRPAAEVAAFEYLAQEADPGSVVLAAFETGNALPAWAPARVVIGHGPESVGLDDLLPRVAAFYAAETAEAERHALLVELGVSHVFWGPAERELGAWDPAASKNLEQVYQENGVSIYKVLLNSVVADTKLPDLPRETNPRYYGRGMHNCGSNRQIGPGTGVGWYAGLSQSAWPTLSEFQ